MDIEKMRFFYPFFYPKESLMDQQTYTITFDNVSEGDADRYAGELRNFLLDAAPDIEVERRREDPYTQDFGATLILILGTPAIVAAVNRIGDWLALRNKAEIVNACII